MFVHVFCGQKFFNKYEYIHGAIQRYIECISCVWAQVLWFKIHLEAITFNRPSRFVGILIMLSWHIMGIILFEIYPIYATILKYYLFKFLRMSVEYVARGSILCALEWPRASGRAWDLQTLSAVTCKRYDSIQSNALNFTRKQNGWVFPRLVHRRWTPYTWRILPFLTRSSLLLFVWESPCISSPRVPLAISRKKLPSKRRMASLEAPVRRTYFASETAGASIRCPPMLLEGHANWGTYCRIH